MDVEIDITAGESYPLPVVNAIADTDIITGPAYLRFISLRDTFTGVPVNASGSVVAPAASATIAATSALPAGTYAVTWIVGLQGAAAAADANNFQLRGGAPNAVVSVNPGAAGEYVQLAVEFTVTTGQVISVVAVGAGTAGVTYTADIQATPTGETETIVEVMDGARIVAELSFRSDRVQNVNFGRPGTCIETVLHLHVISGGVTGAFHVAYDKP